jgi:hypothetical protein
MVAHREDCEAGCLIGMLAGHTLGSGKTPQRRLAPLGPSWRGASLTVSAAPTTRPPIADQRPPLVHALRDLTLLACHVPEGVEVVLRIIAGVAETDAPVLRKRRDLPIPRTRWRAGPGRCRERADARPGRAIPPVISVAVGSIGHSGICIHRVAVMSPVRGQSGRSGESEDSKTNKNASGHSQLL